MIQVKETDVKQRKQTLLDSMPDYYQESVEVGAIMHANAREIERKRAEGQDLLNQMYVMTATWGLDYWDRVLALEPVPRMTIAKRRQRIIAKLGGSAPATIKNLTDILNVYAPRKDAYIDEYAREYRFEAVFPVTNGHTFDIGEVYVAINELKPAHLEFLIAVLVSVTINIRSNTYTFGVPYPITNRFRTESINGRVTTTAIKLKDNTYSFPVRYPITNIMRTDSKVGRIASVKMKLQYNTYQFAVQYPFCNQFSTSSIGIDDEKEYVLVEVTKRSNEVLYKRAGTIYAGEGDI